jgi:hypothetical protein
MTFEQRPGEERQNLEELEPQLRRRIAALDEPVRWDDWNDVVHRSRRAAAWARRFIAVGGATLVAATLSVLAFHQLAARTSGNPVTTVSSGGRELVVLPHGQGFCYRWVGITAACAQLRPLPLDVTWRSNEILGTVARGAISSVELRFTDGTSVRPAISWAARPVRSGFFAFHVPAGKTVAVVTGLHDGRLVRRVTWYSV